MSHCKSWRPLPGRIAAVQSRRRELPLMPRRRPSLRLMSLICRPLTPPAHLLDLTSTPELRSRPSEGFSTHPKAAWPPTSKRCVSPVCVKGTARDHQKLPLDTGRDREQRPSCADRSHGRLASNDRSFESEVSGPPLGGRRCLKTQPRPAQAAIRTELGAIFVSLELSRRTGRAARSITSRVCARPATRRWGQQWSN